MSPARELIVDLFAGGGGASTAIFNATGRHPDIAVNHNPTAIGVHQANHPETLHYTCDVREVDPVEACSIDGVLQPVGLMWASPDCTHFSKARGGKPVEKGIRSLADVVVVWAAAVRPRLIHLENVEEFKDWGPVLENGQPCPESKGLDFRRWVKDLETLGYVVDWRELVAADYGAPTTRKRLFLIARCDGEPIRWPEPTHASRANLAKGDLFQRHLKPWKAAADIIDWNVPVPSIFDRKRPLKPKTQARIAKGLQRYVIQSPNPFIVPVTHTADAARTPRSADEPLQTITRAKGGELAVTAPTIVPITHAGSDDRVYDPTDPMKTVTAAHRGETGLASAMLTSVAYGDDRPGAGLRAWPADGPARTITGSTDTALATAALIRTDFTNTRAGCAYGPEQPVRTITSQPGLGLMGAALVPRYGEREGQEPRARDVNEPYPVVVPTGNGGDLAGIYLEQQNTRDVGADAAAPLRTVAGKAHQGVVAAHMQRQQGQSVGSGAGDPLGTLMPTGAGKTALLAAHLHRQFGSNVSGRDIADAAPTVMPDGTGGKTGIVGASLEQTLLGGASVGVGGRAGQSPPRGLDDPLHTVTAKADRAATIASMVQHNGGRVGRAATEPVTSLTDRSTQQQLLATTIDKYYGSGVAADSEEPLDTVTSKGRFGLAGAFMEQANTGVVGHSTEEPVSTILAAGCHQRLIEAGMVSADDPIASVRRAQVVEFLWAHFGEPTDGEWADPAGSPGARLKFGLVIIAGKVWQIVDIGMRMLVPRELFNAQGFPPTYIIEVTFAGAPVTKTAQTSMAGNSVSPPPAEASLRSNLTWMTLPERRAA